MEPDEAFSFDSIEAAYRAVFSVYGELPENIEIRILNLHNHILWRSYAPGIDPEMDAIVAYVLNSNFGYGG